jgi:hypothetical protein
MGRIERLNEYDINRIVRKVLSEQTQPNSEIETCFKKVGLKMPSACMGSDSKEECIDALKEMIFDPFDPITQKAVKALACIVGDKNSPVMY